METFLLDPSISPSVPPPVSMEELAVHYLILRKLKVMYRLQQEREGPMRLGTIVIAQTVNPERLYLLHVDPRRAFSVRRV